MEGGTPVATAAGADAGSALDKAPLDQVLSALAVKPDQGLTAAEAKDRLAKYGPNGIAEHEESFGRKVLHCFVGPIAFMIEAAAVVSAILGHWPDFVIIVGLLVFNAVLDLWQDRKASNALAALKKGLAPEADGAARRPPGARSTPPPSCPATSSRSASGPSSPPTCAWSPATTPRSTSRR